jgi:protease II
MILNVPFLDPMTTRLDPEIPLTKVEYLEWGNPAESTEMYDYMASYAPYDTIPEYDNQKQITMRRQRVVKQQQQLKEDESVAGTKSSASSQDDDGLATQSSQTTRSALTSYPPPPITSRRPALMISCGERDQRVDHTQSTKFVARLRSRLEPWYGVEGKEACVLMIDENRGHFGNGTQDDRVKNWAREVVFLLGNVQMEGGGGHPLASPNGGPGGPEAASP